MSTSTSMLGGVRAQLSLRQTFIFLNMFPLNKPEVIVPNAKDKFDEHTRIKVKELINALVQWTTKLKINIPTAEINAEHYPYEQATQQMKGRC